jgi:hypothetical protein
MITNILNRKDSPRVEVQTLSGWVQRIYIGELSTGILLCVHGASETDFKVGNNFDTVQIPSEDWREVHLPSYRSFKDGEEFFNIARDNWFVQKKFVKDQEPYKARASKIKKDEVTMYGGGKSTYKEILEHYLMFDPIIKEWFPAGILIEE